MILRGLTKRGECNTVDDEEQLVRVELVGPRNDREIYRLARRLGLL